MTDTTTAPPRFVTVQHGNGPSQLNCKVFREGRAAGSPSHLHEISEILNEPGTLVWFDLVDPGGTDMGLLQEEFGLHPLAIEDAVQAHERPKIEAYGDYWFLVIQGTTVQDSDSVLQDGDSVLFHEMAIFAGEKFLVTVRHDPAYPLEEIEQRWHAHPERLRRGGGFLLYTILDTVVDGYFPVADRLEDQVDVIEAGLFEGSPLGVNVVHQIFNLKQQGQEFRRAVLPMRDILNPIIRGDLTLFPEEEVIYYRDVYDHAIRVVDQLDTLRDLLASALDIHLSTVANQQNEVAKQLTIIATIFLPLSFLTGFFGQNFGFLVQDIGSTWSFWALGIGTEVVTLLLMVAFFKWRRWF